jgi:hypothetical protein
MHHIADSPAICIHIARLVTEYPFSLGRHTRESGYPVIAYVRVEAKARGILDRPVEPDDDG